VCSSDLFDAPGSDFTSRQAAAAGASVLAAKVVQLCTACGGSILHDQVALRDIGCPDCPTIAKLLAIGAAVMHPNIAGVYAAVTVPEFVTYLRAVTA
jgi:hypothetical protein